MMQHRTADDLESGRQRRLAGQDNLRRRDGSDRLIRNQIVALL